MPSETPASLAALYPHLAFAIHDPEVGPIYVQAHNEGWPEDKFRSRIMATNWWKTKQESTRNYITLSNSDPATFWGKVEDIQDTLFGMALDYGVPIDNNWLHFMAKTALYYGMEEPEIRRMMAREIEKHGLYKESPLIHKVRGIASEYHHFISDKDASTWAAWILSGKKTEESFRALLKEQSKGMYPHLAHVLDSGTTMKAYFEPYRQQVAQLLEISPEDVSWQEPRWQRILSDRDEKGAARTMPLHELSTYVRKQPEWRKTRQARDQAAEIGQSIAQAFGQTG